MTLPEATTYLRRYQKWRRENVTQQLIQGGFQRSGINMAIDVILNATNEIKTLTAELNSARSKLRKAQVERENLHFQLRSKRQIPCTPPNSTPSSSPLETKNSTAAP